MNNNVQPLNKPERAKKIEQDEAQVVLGLVELEKIFSIYHGSGKENDFFKSSGVRRD